jgi:hypothetical protein
LERARSDCSSCGTGTLLETLAGQIALALERVHFVEVAQDALVRMESERLRNGLLSALSHDLRTPLTVLAGLADSLPLAGPPLPEAQAEIAQAIRAESLRTSILVSTANIVCRGGQAQRNGSPWRKWWGHRSRHWPSRWRGTSWSSTCRPTCRCWSSTAC